MYSRFIQTLKWYSTINCRASTILFKYTRSRYLFSQHSINLHQNFCFSTTQIPPINYYKILGVNPYATSQQIKNAYINLAKIYHPDANGNDKYVIEKFKAINEAYEILSDVNKRMEYDQHGKVNIEEKQLSSGTDSSYHQFKTLVTGFSMNSLITKNINLKLTFLEAINGGNHSIEIPYEIPCKHCEDDQQTEQAVSKECPHCKGTGYRDNGGTFYREKCHHCNGPNKNLPTNNCLFCTGKGKIKHKKILKIDVPKGIQTDDTMILKMPDDSSQSIKIKFHVSQSDEFRRENYDIYSEKEIKLSQAILGDKITVKGIYDDHTIDIQPGTQSHQVIKLAGKGIKKGPTMSAGDHYVTVKVRIPSHLTNQQLTLIQKFAKIETPFIGKNLTIKRLN